jgi:hypothetical protein
MSGVLTRQVLRGASARRNEIREVLQGIFASELLYPSRCLWLVAPQLRDVEVLDNHGAAFRGIDPDLPRAGVRLSEVLRRVLERGTQVVVATRPLPECRRFTDTLMTAARARSVTELLSVVTPDVLHMKGLIGDGYALSGSMDFTFGGIELQTELVTLQTDPAEVAKLRVAFHGEYGGTL